jgi:O-acetylhomoserine (thiol)-lyase
MKLESIALHHGYESKKNDQKAATVPIYQTSGFTIDDTQHGADLFDLKVEGNIYTRIGNPTNDVLEKRVAEMEGGIAGLSLASGMAAITYAIQTITRSGDNIISTNQLYGGTYNCFTHSFPKQGITVKMVDGADYEGIEAAIDEKN